MWLRMLVPLDGSPLAERAVELAAILARRTVPTSAAGKPLLLLFQAGEPALWRGLPGRGARPLAVEAATH